MSDTDPRETEHHPRLRSELFGHEVVERRLLAAFQSGRLHHAWLLTGPRGIGKATLAYRFARYILRYPDPAKAPFDMNVDPDDGVFKRVAARGHADLLTVERPFDDKLKRLKGEIGVTEARSVSHFFGRTAGEGGWRICIVDAADDLSIVAANAILKILEEPPDRSLFMLICQQSPGRLLATVRSRCIRQDLAPLCNDLVGKVLRQIGQAHGDNAELNAAARLANGSPGRALDLLGTGSAQHLLTFEGLVSLKPPFDRSQMFRLADQLSNRNQQQTYEAFCDLLREWIMCRASQTARSGEAALAAAVRWSDAYRDVEQAIDKANTLNLDRRSVMLEAFRRIEQVERSNSPT